MEAKNKIISRDQEKIKDMEQELEAMLMKLKETKAKAKVKSERKLLELREEIVHKETKIEEISEKYNEIERKLEV